MSIIAVAGRKGGIGKSTIAGNLAGQFVTHGRTVIALDADPQHSLAEWAAQGDGLLSKSVRKVEADLRTAAKSAEREADIVIVDTPPGLPEITFEAALTADVMLLPCGPSPLDIMALRPALSLALKARAQRSSKKPRIRFVPSRVLMNTNLGRNLSVALEKLGKKVLPGIGQRIVLAEAVEHGLTIVEYAPTSTAAEEFQALTKAVKKLL
ncbi:MAG: ParA family protein [Acidobacteriota bacterium]|nr:ParA family protein [Acidobacteriota bacterium]